ncbi:MAG: AMP-binding protein [Thermoguttaceae bacterium]|nr:AMP-binding protein [Thermoguttaceae bacterium]MDW8037938.1 AMP-binding protein [Thermoguttaceae bacterium]
MLPESLRSTVSLSMQNRPPPPPGDLPTLGAVLRWRAQTTADAPAFTFLADGETLQTTWTYADLDLRARRIGGYLQCQGACGQRVALLFEGGPEFTACFYGCLYAGAIPVPVNPPDLIRLSRTLPRLEAVLEDAQSRWIIGPQAVVQAVAETFWQKAAEMYLVAWEGLASSNEQLWHPPKEVEKELAFLQYTSGSTGTPRGIMVSHQNLLASLAAMHREDLDSVVGVTWLPPYHDMGLIGGVLLPVYSGRWTIVIPTRAFVERPLRWLRAISHYRGTTSGGPNFGYELCIRKFRPEECQGLDLSCWKIAVVGAEPVWPETIERFIETFRPYGFRPEAFLPAYGLAEAVLNVTSGRWFEPVVIRSFLREGLEEGRVVPCEPTHPRARRLVGCGRPWSGHRVAIVDPKTCLEMPPDRIGEIWVRSPNVAQGYWNRPEETRQVFHARLADTQEGPFLRTGDLGFFYEGQLFFVGRLKELIVLRGRNYYPQDIEAVVAKAHPSLSGCQGAAFSIPGQQEERLVIVHEVRGSKRRDWQSILEAIRRELAAEFCFLPYAVVLIPAGRLPRTSSGKPRRQRCREMFLAGSLEVLAQWQAGRDAFADQVPYVAPRTPLEEAIAKAWAEVLSLPQVGIHDNFFALGGNSLLAMGLYMRLKELVPVDLPLERFFERPTVAGLAEVITETLLAQLPEKNKELLLEQIEDLPEPSSQSPL